MEYQDEQISKRRYVTTITVYTYVKDPDINSNKSDIRVIKKAEKFAEKLRKIYPNSYAKVESIHEQPFATMISRKLDL